MRRVVQIVLVISGVLLGTLARTQVTFEPIANLWTPDVRGTAAYGGVIQGSDGAFYGTTPSGGPTGGERGNGTVYRVGVNGTVTLLHEFLGPPNDIGPPVGELVEAPDGNLYGLALGGNVDAASPCGPGVVFKITPAGALSVVHALAAYDPVSGAFPEGLITGGCGPSLTMATQGLTLAPDGSFYGAFTGGGIHGGGTIVKLTSAGAFSVIHHVRPAIGPNQLLVYGPTGLTLGSDGSFYGSMMFGGLLFKVTPDGILTKLHEFNEPDGGGVMARPVEGDDGNFYGFTRPNFGCGTFYRLTPSGVYTRILSMPVDANGCPAGHPELTSVRKGADGNFYVPAGSGGEASSGYGTLIRVTPAGDLTVLHTFTADRALIDGYYPTGRLLETSPGVFYGTTTGFGGTVVFRMTVPPPNRAPLALDDLLNTDEDLPGNGTLGATDLDNDPLTYTLVANATKGVVSITNFATGAYTYTPNPNANGSDSFTFSANDGTVDSNVATVTVTITPANDPPTASGGSASVMAGSSTTGTLAASDIDSPTLTLTIAQNGTKGVATITNPTTGAFTYTANVGTSGTDTFTFKAYDGELDSNVATVTVTIEPVACTPATNVTSQVTVTVSRFQKDRATGHLTQRVRVQNPGTVPIVGPISYVLDQLPEGTTVVGSSGLTACTVPTGSPFVTLNVGADGVLSRRERVEFVLDVISTTGTTVTYNPRVLAGTGAR